MDLDIAALYLPPIPFSEPTTPQQADPEAEEETGSQEEGQLGRVFDVDSAVSLTTCLACLSPLVLSSSAADPATDPIQLLCTHIYCPTCLHRLLISSRASPPSCCSQPLPPELIDKVLQTEEEKVDWRRRVREWETKGEKVYCSEWRECGAFVGARQMAPREGNCEKCGRGTCMACRASWHGSTTSCLPSASAEEATTALKLMKTNQARRCPSCRLLISRIDGCPFVRCLCGSTFCDRCGRAALEHSCTCLDESVWSVWGRSLARSARRMSEGLKMRNWLCTSVEA